jgi:hypothetical protein
MPISASAHSDGRRTVRVLAGVGLGALLSLAGCGVTGPKPGPQSAAGMIPVGTVQLTENFVSGVAAGSGTLYFQGQSYGFKLAGAIVGPGVAVDRMLVQGDVYGLTQLSDFGGAYRQSTGHVGASTTPTADLWLENNAHVVMHLTGTQQGAILSLGRDEIVIRLNQ